MLLPRLELRLSKHSRGGRSFELEMGGRPISQAADSHYKSWAPQVPDFGTWDIRTAATLCHPAAATGNCSLTTASQGNLETS